MHRRRTGVAAGNHHSVSLISVWLIAVVSLALLWGFEFHLLEQDRNSAKQHAATVAGVMADSLAQRAVRVIQNADALTLLVRSDYVRDPANFRFDAAWTRRVMSDAANELVTIVGSDGFVRLTTGSPGAIGDPADRRDIKVHFAADDSGPFIGQAVVAKSARQPSIQISRPISKPDGSLAGIVVVSQPPSAFTEDVIEGEGPQTGSLLAVYRASDSQDGGVPLAVRVGTRDTQATWIPLAGYDVLQSGGTVLLADPADHVRRFLARRQVPGYPLVVVAGIGEQEALAGFHVMRNSRLVTAGIATLVMVAFFLIIAGLMRRLLASRDRLRGLAETDSLTKAFNRWWLYGWLDEHYARSPRQTLGLIYVDLNNFKHVNDRFGHTVGDIVIVKMADRLRAVAGPRGKVARIGGDEYCVLLESHSAFEDAAQLSAAIREDLSMPFIVAGHALSLTVSIGGAVSLPVDDSRGSLLRRADLAMYESKRAIQSLGGSAVCFYTPELDERSDALSTLSHDLREALERKEIYAALEPIVDIRSNALVGYEVMARWQHPQKGEIPARQFIGVAEAEGFAHAISEYVFDLACRRWSDMETVFGRELILSFNISAAEFAVDDLAERMSRRARVYGIAPEKVQIEIPESCLSDDPWKSGERVAELREAGLGVVLAGFGQSPTSYEHLMGLNFSALQIPAGFVRGTPDDRRRSGVVQSMIVLARSMDLQVIAQGVECAQQHMWLAELGDVLAQGSFYFPEHAVKLMPDGRDTADDLVERPG